MFCNLKFKKTNLCTTRHSKNNTNIDLPFTMSVLLTRIVEIYVNVSYSSSKYLCNFAEQFSYFCFMYNTYTLFNYIFYIYKAAVKVAVEFCIEINYNLKHLIILI